MRHLETLRRIAREQRTRAEKAEAIVKHHAADHPESAVLLTRLVKAEARVAELDAGWSTASQTILKMEHRESELWRSLSRIVSAVEDGRQWDQGCKPDNYKAWVQERSDALDQAKTALKG